MLIYSAKLGYQKRVQLVVALQISVPSGFCSRLGFRVHNYWGMFTRGFGIFTRVISLRHLREIRCCKLTIE